MTRELPTSLEEAYKATLVLIPAYNAAGTVGEVIAGIAGLSPDLSVLVVDDGSRDGTGEAAREAGAEVLTHKQNMGKGEALRTGFRRLLEGPWMAVITMDADGQHSPSEIPGLVRCWLADGADIVIGTRRRDLGKMPVLRILSNSISSWLVSLAARCTIRDSQSGYRLLRRDVVAGIGTGSGGYTEESEILIKAGRQGYRIGAATISTIYEDEKSYVHPLKQPLLFLGLIARSVFWRVKPIDRER